MADPGFVSGLIGAGIAEILDRCIKAAERSLAWEGHCNYIKTLLEQLLPLVEAINKIETEADPNDVNHTSLARNVHSSIDELHNILCEAEDVLNECANPNFKLNLVKRHQATVRLRKTEKRVKDFILIKMPLINHATIHYKSEKLEQRLEVIPDQVADRMRKERYASTIMFLGLQTQNKLLSCADFNKDRAFATIKDGADQLLHLVSERSGETSSSFNGYTGLNDQVEDQPLPRFVFGMDQLNSRLHELLLHPDSNECKWIGIWAKGGAGKTLLVQTAMNSLLIRAHYDHKVYMVQIGNTRNVLQVQRKLALKIEPLWTWSAKTPDEGKTELFNILQRKLSSTGKCLIILDDVWDADTLHWFDVLNNTSGSCIVLTTRNQDVVLSKHATELSVGMLSEQDSTKLFCVHTFGKEDAEEVQPTHPLCDVVKSIIKECGGLPLALKVVGGALAATPLDRPGQWNLALYKLREAIGLGKSHEEQLYCRLKLSYDYLECLDVPTSGQMYKECFLYFAAYPEDKAIQTQDLVNLWIAEGLIKSTGSVEAEAYSTLGLDPETEAYSVLGVLIGRSLVELDSKEWSFEHNTTLLTCKIHDVLRDLALHIIQGNNTTSWESGCLFKAGWTLPEPITGADRKVNFDTIVPPRQKPFKELLQKTRKLSLVESNINSLPNSKVTGAPPLEVLLLENNPGLTKIPKPFLGSFVKLKVLELSRTGITTLPPSLGELRNLILLSLHHTRIESLPTSLGRLTSLHHLDLNYCENLKSLPGKALSQLVNLTYLNTRGCRAIWDERVVVRAGICCTTVGEYAIEQMENLAALTQLKKLWICSDKKQSIPGKAIGKLVSLKYASLYFPDLRVLPDDMQTLVNLETLDLNTCRTIAELPVWVGEHMRSLKSLDLRGCSKLTQLHNNLSQLTNLKKIELSGCTALTELPESLFNQDNCFPLLEELWLQGCTKLNRFPEVAEGAIRSLATLNISYCVSLATLPDSFSHLGIKLVYLDMGSCNTLNMDYITSQHLSAFVCLQDLVLKNNPQLTILPLSIVLLPKLAKLDVSGCPKLKQLPHAHDFQPQPSYYFPSLQELLAANSGLEDIPVSIIDIPSLKLLNVRDCDKLLHQASCQESAWRAQAKSRSGQLVVLG